MPIPKHKVPAIYPIKLTEKEIAYALLALRAYVFTADCDADEHTDVMLKLADTLAHISINKD
jgi:hypothetical protein